VIRTERSIRLFLAPLLCWAAVLVSTRGFADDATALSAAASTGTNAPAAMPQAAVTASNNVTATAGVSNNVPAAASTAAGQPAPAPMTKSENVTINLINRLVQKGVLTPEDAKELIQQAEADAAQARAEALKTQPPSPPSAASTDDTVNVRYVPEIVKAQIRDEIEGDVMQQARAEHWVSPNLLPAWVSRFQVFGDFRMRYEDFFFPHGNFAAPTNAPLGVFPNFNAINTGSPFDVSGVDFAPQRDVDQDRTLVRLRARIGAQIDMEDNYTLGLRLATGQDDQPVSANQSLGAANNGQGGDFSKYAIWVDRAFLKYEIGGVPAEDLSVSVGRFDNPFMSTSIIWEDNIGFDGLALQAKKELLPGVTPFFAGGAFPVFSTDFNFSSDRPSKYPSEDKWLYAEQVGVDWRVNPDIDFKGACAYYYFDHVEGKLSSPFVPATSADQGSTDDTRPSFAQFGNTYMKLRDIIPTAENNFGTIDQWQYFGLATPFRDLDFTAKLDYEHFEPFTISLYGEWVWNTAFDRSSIDAVAVNNLNNPGSTNSVFAGGDTGWIFGVKLGRVLRRGFQRRRHQRERLHHHGQRGHGPPGLPDV